MRNAWEKGLMMVMVMALVVAPSISYGAPANGKADVLKVNSGKLAGVVVDSRGNAQSDVMVKVMRDGKLFAQVKTNKKGEYTVAKLPEGKAQIVVRTVLASGGSEYIDPSLSALAEELRTLFESFYENAPFVHVVAQPPGTKEVRGSNYAHLFPTFDSRNSRVVVTSVIDNLVKGAAGQAIHNANIALELDQTTGLEAAGVYP